LAGLTLDRLRRRKERQQGETGGVEICETCGFKGCLGRQADRPRRSAGGCCCGCNNGGLGLRAAGMAENWQRGLGVCWHDWAPWVWVAGEGYLLKKGRIKFFKRTSMFFMGLPV
jgi:hypothetical protein